ncbi:MAG: response regulator [Syntrophales bacterium]|nr:response regulator [Syntrophales bacterium]MDD5232222.1 response regulator [Syntrophales bacterium]MDD5532647.1 response regulator [Syntrophales bacterium]
MMKVLVVDDEKDIVDLVSFNLKKEGFAVEKAYDGERAMRIIRDSAPDLILLDLMLPGIQGMDVCRMVRRDPRLSYIPVIMLTAKTDEVDKVLGLEIGADDYITKPFSVRELIARIRAVMRRFESGGEAEKKKTFSYKGLRIDYDSFEISLDGRKIDLSPTEARLLIFFSKNPGKVFTRSQILDRVWGENSFVEPRTVDVHIRRLRAQIEKDSDNPAFIVTVRGAGYKFAAARE